MDWFAAERDTDMSESDWPVEAVAERMERAVEEATALISDDRALNDLPKHCAPLLQTSPATVKLPF